MTASSFFPFLPLPKLYIPSKVCFIKTDTLYIGGNLYKDYYKNFSAKSFGQIKDSMVSGLYIK